jgi:RNA methyltransferase, TrmH family
MRRVSSRQNSAVRAFRTLAADRDSTAGRLLLDGAHLVRDARNAGLHFEIAAVAASRLLTDTEERRLAEALDLDGVDVMIATDGIVAAMSPVRTPSGIVAIARREPVAVADVCRRSGGFVLTVVDVQDPGNLGSLVRVAEAGGVTGAIVATASRQGGANPFSWKALRGSMGSALRLPIAVGVTAAAAIDSLKKAGARIVAAIPRGGPDPDEIDWTGQVGLVLGSEGAGLPDELTARCQATVTVPMATGVESLNVAVAGAILIYAARRQR